MPISTPLKRESALRSPRRTLRPDDVISARDRLALLGQYAGELPTPTSGFESLSFRHQRLFLGLADIWKPVNGIGPSGGLPQTFEGNAPVQTAVPYVLDRKSATESPYVLGQIEGSDLITTDTARFPPGVELHSSWVIIDRSITIQGVPGENYNGGWIVLGDPVSDDDLDEVRRAGMVEAYTARLSDLPATIKAYYAG